MKLFETNSPKDRNIEAARQRPWYTPHNITTQSGMNIKTFHDFDKAVEFVMKASASTFYKHCTFSITYRGTRDPSMKGKRPKTWPEDQPSPYDFVDREIRICEGRLTHICPEYDPWAKRYHELREIEQAIADVTSPLPVWL